MPGRSSRRRWSVSAASEPIVSIPAARSRASERGPTPGSRRTSNGAGRFQGAYAPEELSLAAGEDDDEAARLPLVARDLGDDLAGRDAERARQIGCPADRGLYRLGQPAR